MEFLFSREYLEELIDRLDRITRSTIPEREIETEDCEELALVK